MLIWRKTNGKEVTVNMQEVSYGRIMRKINLTGNLAYTQSPHVSTWSRLIQDMPLVCIPRCGLRILCQWNLDSGFLELNSGFLNPRNPDFESNNNPHLPFMGRCTKPWPVPLHRKVITIDLFQPVWEASRAISEFPRVSVSKQVFILWYGNDFSFTCK